MESVQIALVGPPGCLECCHQIGAHVDVRRNTVRAVGRDMRCDLLEGNLEHVQPLLLSNVLDACHPV